MHNIILHQVSSTNPPTLKKILIISPHFPPSNLTAVHRARFFANHLPEFGWEPIVLTVHEDHYEEKPDWNLHQLLPKTLRVEKVGAMRVTKPRIIGDIGLRAFYQMYRAAKRIIESDKVDFLYITIPSFYGALWGRWLHETTGIPYGIDYIDPWVHVFPGSEMAFSRHWFSTRLSAILEPVAVKKASLISGVAASYFEGVIERNRKLRSSCRFVAIPYGSEKSDHDAVHFLNISPYLFQKKAEKIQLVYAGAMLPKAYGILETIFEVVRHNEKDFQNLEIHFIGSGKSPTDREGYNIRSLAEKHGLWQRQIFEYPARIPYLDVLVHLDAADGVFILGSTEPHYTPSKVYQAVLSKKPIFAVLHEESTGSIVIRESGAGLVLDFNEENALNLVRSNFIKEYERFLEFMKWYNPNQIDSAAFSTYSAKNITGTLSKELAMICNTKNA